MDSEGRVTVLPEIEGKGQAIDFHLLRELNINKVYQQIISFTTSFEGLLILNLKQTKKVKISEIITKTHFCLTVYSKQLDRIKSKGPGDLEQCISRFKGPEKH